MNKELLSQKTDALHALLLKFMPMAVAFSGGVDSTFLLSEAYDLADDKSRVIALTADSPIHPKRETESAESFCREKGIRHFIIETVEMGSPEFVANDSNRCYACKKIIFSSIIEAAQRLGVHHVAHAVNTDDLSEFRPGIKAAEEMRVLAPLAEAGLGKSEIRLLSRQKGLANWDKPASGCLATRIPYGQTITAEKLQKIDSAEQALADLGFSGCRVRYYGDLAKIEVPPEDLAKIMENPVRDAVVSLFKKIGFLYISLDIEGYASGRLNRSLTHRESF